MRSAGPARQSSGAAAVDAAADLTREERRALAALAFAVERVAAGRASVALMTATAAKILAAALEAIGNQPGRPT